MTDFEFDMPASGTWEQRGGWVVAALARDFNLTAEQAAGIVGNLGFESIGFTTMQELEPAVSGSRGGFGWAQWTGPRRRGFEAWAESNDLDPASDEANYGFLCYELAGVYKRTITALRKCNTVDAAVWSVGQTYERPGGTTATNLPGYTGRLLYAKRALAGTELPPPKPFAPSDAMTLQRKLVAMGYAIAIDGRAGPETCGAALAAIAG